MTKPTRKTGQPARDRKRAANPPSRVVVILAAGCFTAGHHSRRLLFKAEHYECHNGKVKKAYDDNWRVVDKPSQQLHCGRLPKLAGGDIRQPTFSRPTRGSSAKVETSSATSAPARPRVLGASATPSGTSGACICLGPLIGCSSIVGILSDIVRPILTGGVRVSLHDHCTPLLRFTSIAPAVAP
jgi:hypothetical protein